MSTGTETVKKFKADLHRGSLGLTETRRLLEAFAETHDLEEVNRKATLQNLLGKTSDAHVRAMLSAFRRRFIQDLGLPSLDVLGLAIRSSIPEVAKNQLLLPYYLRSDLLVEFCYRDMVLSQLGQSSPRLTTQEIVNWIAAVSVNHPELKEWSDYLRIRWSRGFLALLRQFALMEQHPKKQLKRLWLLPEAFGTFWLWLWGKDKSFWVVQRNNLWQMLQLSSKLINDMLAEGELRRWWHFEKLGSIVQFESNYANVEEWLKTGMV
jgi:hypothetical protein